MGNRTFGIGVLLSTVAGCGAVVSNPDASVSVDASIACDTSVPIDTPDGSCAPLTDPAFGMVTTTNGSTYPSTATYTCTSGFNLVGSATRTCAPDGSWSDAAPTCTWTGPRNFTDCTQTGNTGPSQAQCDAAYATTTLAGTVTVTAGVQLWTVPATGTYRIVAAGAAGSSLGGWLGARMEGSFALTQGTVLKILVGQLPTGVLAGGGGSFVVTQAGNMPLIVAGGGGSGNCATHCIAAEAGGRIETTGGTMTGLARATAGAGGVTGNAVSGAGAGFLANGQSGGVGFINGGLGSVGMTGYLGGFGGGGARNGANGTGGGGGYSGGAANSNGTDTTIRFGGGGGSFNTGTNQTNTPNVNAATGLVTIDLP